MHGRFILNQVTHQALFDRLALVDDHIALRQPAGHDEVLFDQQHRGIFRELLNGFHHLFDKHRSQPFARLVDQQQIIVGDQRPGDGQHLLLPA